MIGILEIFDVSLYYVGNQILRWLSYILHSLEHIFDSVIIKTCVVIFYSLGSVVAHFQALFMEYTEEVETELINTLTTELIITNPGPLPTVNTSDSIQVAHKREDNDCKSLFVCTDPINHRTML